MARHTQDEFELKDGNIFVYRRSDVTKPLWQCRIKFPNQRYVRKSLKTRNKATAIQKAEKLFDDLRFRHERGMPLQSYGFADALEAYFTWLENQTKTEPDADKARRLEKKLSNQKKYSRYVREYFGERLLDGITGGDIEQYKDWRKSYWTTGAGSKLKFIEYVRNGRTVRTKPPIGKLPSLSTLASEDALLRAVFDRAVRRSWITREYVPEITTVRPAKVRRFGFTDVEVGYILDMAQKRIDEAENDHLIYLRGMLRDFVGLLAFTGMRPFEAMKLQWHDIETYKTKSGKLATKIYVSGKNKERILVTRDDATDYVFNIDQRINIYRLGNDDGAHDELTGYVFSQIDGTQIKSFKKGLRTLLEAAGARQDTRGKERDAYSFRHYYATQRLQKGVSVYSLAENMGTSVQVIEDHYGHLKPEMVGDELTVE